jgi:diguanylate cyclase (GGDEF)-like protein
MPKILVIDDDEDFRKMIRILLELNKYTVETAEDGYKGLEKVKNCDFDLILLDVMMPGMTGIDVCYAIRIKNPEIPIVLLTAKGEKEDVVTGINAGASDYITKHFETEVLLAKIKSLIRLKELQDELKKANKLLENLATTDGLTGIYNHRFFYEKLNEEFERSKRYSSYLSLIMFDLDFFKKINDRYGHMVGDSVLVEMSKIVLSNIRKNDIFARYGGEEFVLLLPHTNAEGALHEAERIRKAIESNHFQHLEKRGDVTISLGVVTFPSKYINQPEDMVKLADAALYEAKRLGRNRSIHYEEMEKTNIIIQKGA